MQSQKHGQDRHRLEKGKYLKTNIELSLMNSTRMITGYRKLCQQEAGRRDGLIESEESMNDRKQETKKKI